MKNSDSEACRICKSLSGDNEPECDAYARSACLSKDRAMLILLNQILEASPES